MTQEQLILLKRSLNIYASETEAWAALDNLTHIQGQPVVAFFRRSTTEAPHGDTALGAIFAIGTANGVGKYKACSSHDDMMAIANILNTHITEWVTFKNTFDKMFEYDGTNKAIKAKLDFYTIDDKNISAGGLGGSGSSSLGALYQLIDVMINSTGDGVEGAVEGSVLAYDATAGKWKAIAQSEILPNMSDYYTKDETDAAINAIPIYSMAKLSALEITSLSDGTNVREAYRLKKGGNNVDDTVIKIYKDSAIKSLELRDNKYLVLTYIDNEGNEQSISKDLSVIVNDNYVDLINNQEIGGIKTFTEKTIFKKDINVLGDGIFGGEVVAIAGDAEPAGVTNYAQLQGKPSINGKELASGDNTLDELGIQPKGDYTTASQLDTILKNYVTKVFASNNYASKSAVNTIQALIPATASADNQLADKAFVNSSIATATAEFKGSFTSLDELKATSGNLNDYAFYLHTDSVGNSIVDRYKWTTAGWLYEYTLNNSSFTAEQWAALNSAITATLVQSYNSHLNNSTIHITAEERTKWNNKWDYNEDTIKAVKVNAAVSADELTSNAGTSAIPIYFDGGIPVQCTPSALFYGFANGYDASAGGRILGITIAGHTRKVVVAYSTLAGSADKLATARTLWGKPFDGSADVSGDLKDVGNITASGKATIQGDIISGGEVVAIAGEGTPAGVTDYSALTGKPQINGVTLVSGNNTLAALGIQAAGDYATNSGVTTLLADYAKKTFVSNNYVGKSAFNSHTADTNIHITSAERAAWNAKWDYNAETIKAVKVTSASSADSVAWSGIKDKPSTFTPSAHTHTASEISGLPTKLSAFTNDAGFITGITKSMVEGVLTGNITSHTHSYLPLSGGTLTGSVTMNGIDTNLIRNITYTSTSSWARSLISLQVDGVHKFGISAFGDYTAGASDNGIIFAYIGCNEYTGLNLRISASSLSWGNSPILHSGNYNSYVPTLTGTGASGTWGINITGNAATATNADTLDGYHSYAFRKDWVTKAGGPYIGWVRIMKWTVATAGTFSPYPFLLSLYRQYNSPSPESYTLSFTFGWNTANIVQLNGNGGNRIIEKFRISKTADQLTYYLEYYVNPNYSIYTNNCYCIISSCYNFGSVELINEVASGDTSTLHEITTKLNSIVGNIEGNASSATKLANSYTIFGRSFNGTAKVSGTVSDIRRVIIGADLGDWDGSRAELELITATDNPNDFWLGTNSKRDWCLSGRSSADGNALHLYNRTLDRVATLNQNGNILIGTTTDNGYKLQVNGSERVYGDLIVDGEVSALIA